MKYRKDTVYFNQVICSICVIRGENQNYEHPNQKR